MPNTHGASQIQKYNQKLYIQVHPKYVGGCIIYVIIIPNASFFLVKFSLVTIDVLQFELPDLLHAVSDSSHKAPMNPHKKEIS
jgi:hypothetical protein